MSTPPRIDRFRVLEPLGEGGLLAAWDPELERCVAIKLIVEHGARDRLLEEARAMARLAHPNVVRVHEVGEHDGEIFLAMELVRGDTLASWSAKRTERTPERTAAVLELAIDAARGLAAAHSVGLVHGDLRAPSVLVGADGRARLTGFGLVRERADASEDQRALCAALWTAAFGDDAPTEFAAVLRRGLAPDPAARWPSTTALQLALERARPRPQRHRFVAVVAGLALIAALAVVAWPTRGDPCRATDELAGLWTQARRDTLQSRFATDGTPAAIAGFASVARRLDHFTVRWQSEYFAACEAVREVLPDDRPPIAADVPHMACLDEARTGFAVVLEEIEQLAAGMLGSASTLTLALPDPYRCRDRLAAQEDGHARDVALRLMRAGTLSRIGHVAEVDPILAELASEGWGGSASIECRGHLVAAGVAYVRGDADRAYREGRQALLLAEQADDAHCEAESWTNLALAELWRMRLDEAQFAGERAANVATTLRSPAVLAEALRSQAAIQLQLGRYDAAVASYRAVERLLTQARGGDLDVTLARLYADMAPALIWAGEVDEAIATADRAVVLFENTLGPDSPRTVRAVAVLGTTLAEAGHANEAIDALGRASIALEADPESSPHDRLVVRLRRAEQLAFRRRFDEALIELAALRDYVMDDDGRQLVEMTRAMTLMESGHADEAVTSYTALLAGFPPTDDHFTRFNRAVLHVNLAQALARAGRTDEALALIEPTIAEYIALGMSDARMGGMLVELSEVQRRAGRPADALAQCERALDLLARGRATPVVVARGRLALARALVQLGRAEDAREPASLAAEGLAAAHDSFAAAEAEAIAR